MRHLLAHTQVIFSTGGLTPGGIAGVLFRILPAWTEPLLFHFFFTLWGSTAKRLEYARATFMSTADLLMQASTACALCVCVCLCVLVRACVCAGASQCAVEAPVGSLVWLPIAVCLGACPICHSLTYSFAWLAVTWGVAQP